jgi:hypothetical protein
MQRMPRISCPQRNRGWCTVSAVWPAPDPIVVFEYAMSQNLLAIVIGALLVKMLLKDAEKLQLSRSPSSIAYRNV